jgi:hypothetical protein
MKYFEFPEEGDPTDDGLTYIETDNGWVIRQVTVCDGQFLGSNIDDPTWGSWFLVLQIANP